jgi:hypothetical protein
MRTRQAVFATLIVMGLFISGTASASSSGVVSATGGVHWTIGPEVFGSPVVNRALAFAASKTAAGVASGNFEYHQQFQGSTSRFTGRVTCMNVYDGNRAKIGGIILASNDPTVAVGDFGWFQVFDNGEGASATPDQSSLMGFGDAAANEAFCDSPDLPRFGPWAVMGNIQVDG